MFGGLGRTAIEKAMARDMRGGCSGRERSVAAQQSQQRVRTAAAEKCALSVGRHVDIEHSGYGGGGSLYPARVHVTCAKNSQHILAENILPDAAHQSRQCAPARQTECAIGAHTAAANL